MVAAYKNSNVSLLDLEGFDAIHVRDIMVAQGFDNELKLIRGDGLTDENLGDDLIDAMRDPVKPKKDELLTNVGIFDSIGAISPIAEQEGELGEANMGRRAKLVAQFFRKYVKISREIEKLLFVTNHLQPNMGVPGMHTPGGVTLGYLSAMRIKIIKRIENFKDGSYAIECTVDKNRWGFENRKFYLVILAGQGIHNGLTAFYDSCLFAKDRVVRGTAAQSVKVDDGPEGSGGR